MSRSVSDRIADARAHAVHALEVGERLQTAQQFASDSATYGALLFNIVVIGEAVKFIPQNMREAAPEIPWRSIARTRDLIVHRYWLVDADHIINIVEKGLAPLIGALDMLALILDTSPP